MTKNRPSEDPSDLENQLEAFGSALGDRVSLKERVLADLCLSGTVNDDDSTRFPTSQTQPSTPWFGEFTMLQKISIGSVAVSALLAVTVWFSVVTATVSFAQVIENVQKAASYQADIKMVALTGKKKGQETHVGKWYWRAPFDHRMEVQRKPSGNQGSDEAMQITIGFPDKQGLSWDTQSKTFSVVPPRQGAVSPIMMLHTLANYQGDAAKQLGKKTIGIVSCDGFEIPLEEVDPSAGDGILTVWVSRKTKLPAQVTVRSLGMELNMEAFVWNRQLDDSLFSTLPPDGFEPRKRSDDAPVSDAEKVVAIVRSLSLFAELNEGKYPQVKVIYGDVMQRKLMELAGFADLDLDDQIVKSDLFKRILESTIGWATMTQIMQNNPEAAYNGIDVNVGDKEKVLVRWRLRDGSLQVIYGDLRSEKVAP